MSATNLRSAVTAAAALLTLALQVPLAGGVAASPGPGRNIAACYAYCNALFRLCRAECSSDCGILYPEKGREYGRCLGFCGQSFCSPEHRGCTRRCNVTRPPSSDPEP